MKKYLAGLLACAMLLTGAACGEMAGMTVDMAAGTIRFDSAAAVSVQSVLPLPDGTLLVAVSGGDAPRSGPMDPADETFFEVARRVTLMRLSTEGRVLWKQDLGEADGSFMVRLLSEAADGTALALVEHSVEQATQYKQLRRFSVQDGSLTWSGDKLAPSGDINEYVTPVDGGYLWESIHNAGTSTTPRYYALHARDGTQRWQVDDAQVGVLEQALTVPGGTLLLGRTWVPAIRDYRTCAVLVDDEGRLVWQTDYQELGGSSFMDSSVSPSGQVAAIASVTGAEGQREYALFALDTDGGGLRRLATLPGGINQYSRIAPSGDGWLIGGSYGYEEKNPPALHFIQVDAQGNTLNDWDMPYEAEQVLSPRFFTWKGELWADILIFLEDGGQSSLLQRMD